MKYIKGSFIVVPNIHHLAGIPAITQTIYIWICSYANEKGTCFPSHKRLASDSGTSTATVERHINQLIELGLLKKEKRIVNGRQTSNHYQIMIKDSTVMRGPHQSDEGGGDHSDEAELNPVLTQSNTSEVELRVERVTKEDEEVTPRQKTDLTYRKVFELWPKYPLNWRSNRTEIAAAKNILAEHSLEEARNALNYAKQNEHEEKCPQMLKPSDLDRKWVNLQAFRDKR